MASSLEQEKLIAPTTSKSKSSTSKLQRGWIWNKKPKQEKSSDTESLEPTDIIEDCDADNPHRIFIRHKQEAESKRTACEVYTTVAFLGIVALPVLVIAAPIFVAKSAKKRRKRGRRNHNKLQKMTTNKTLSTGQHELAKIVRV